MLSPFDIDNVILHTFHEDLPQGDITTDSLVGDYARSRAYFIAKESGVIAGLHVSKRAFQLLDNTILFTEKVQDGALVESGEVIAMIEGNTRAMLKAERTALNFLQRLSGIATKTRSFRDKLQDLPVRIVDTRKTTPGLRLLEKYAVRVGGGHNHRHCLSDGVLIKDNHIKAAGGIKQAIELARKSIPHTMKIEVETESLAQVQEALDSRADIIMLDNMSLEMMAEAVKLIDKRAIVEASGNVTLDTVEAIAATGVDVISAGALTHSAPALDISMRITETLL